MKKKKETKKRPAKKAMRKPVRNKAVSSRRIKIKKAKEISAPPELVAVLLPEVELETFEPVFPQADIVHERTTFVSAPLTPALTEWFSEQADQTEDQAVAPAITVELTEPATCLCTSYGTPPSPLPFELNLLPAETAPVIQFRPSRQIIFHVATFAALAFFFVVPFQVFFWYDLWQNQAAAISKSAEQTFSEAKKISQTLNTGNLQTLAADLKKLSESLQATVQQFQEIDPAFKVALRFTDKGKTARGLMDAAFAFSAAGQELVAVTEALSKPQEAKTVDDAIFTVPFVAELFNQRSALENLRQTFESGYKKIRGLDQTNLPTELATRWPAVLETLETTDQLLLLVQDQLDLWYELFGTKNSKRYALVFQNPHELRPTGGFWGSLAEITVRQGSITRLHFPGGGPYDLAGVSQVHVAPPLPLQYVNPEWQIQDANWYFDFPSSAKRFIWFYEKSGGAVTLDGVIALSADILPELLRLTGPINMPEYKTIVTADNFYEVTQHQVEFLYDKKENKPKKFLGDLLNALLPKLKSLNPDSTIKAAQLIADSLASRDFMLYSSNPLLEERLGQYRWNGEMITKTGDYLALVQTNIGGAKTDAKILQTGSLTISPGSERLRQTVEVSRRHTGKRGQLLYGGVNHTFWRFYLPESAELISLEGAEEPIRKEPYRASLPLQKDPGLTTYTSLAQKFSDLVTVTPLADKTEISFWQHLNPGEEKIIRLVYTTPKSLPAQGQPAGEHTWYLQKQPGVKWENFTVTLEIDSNLPSQNLVSSLGDEWQKTERGMVANTPWKYDEWLSLKF